MPTRNFHGNQATLLVYAWICSRSDLRAAVLQEDIADQQRQDYEQVIVDAFAAEVKKIDGESLYRRLISHQVTRVDPRPIAAAVRESSGIFYNASPERETLRENYGGNPTQETRVLCEELKRNTEVSRCLHRLHLVWCGDADKNGRMLHAFFLWHSQLFLRSRPVAFFVQEFVRMALERVHWGEIASRFLPSVQPWAASPVIRGTRTGDAAYRAAFFHELLIQVREELGIWGCDTSLPEDMRALAALVSNCCAHAACLVQPMNGEG